MRCTGEISKADDNDFLEAQILLCKSGYGLFHNWRDLIERAKDDVTRDKVVSLYEKSGCWKDEV